MEKQNLLKNKLTLGRKLNLLLDYLQSGGEINIDGRTYVWCDNVITRQEMDEHGEMQYWGVDGFALKAERIDGGTGESTPHYMGQSDIPLSAFIEMVESLGDEDWLGMTAAVTLRSMNKKR